MYRQEFLYIYQHILLIYVRQIFYPLDGKAEKCNRYVYRLATSLARDITISTYL